MELDPVPVHRQWLLGEVPVQYHVVSGSLCGRNSHHVADHSVEVQLLGVEDTSSEETPQALDHLARSFIVALDVVDDRLEFLQVRRRGLDQQRRSLGVVEDSAEGLIEFMRNGGRQLPCGRSAVHMRQLRHPLPPFDL